jgi:hypothetical protein
MTNHNNRPSKIVLIELANIVVKNNGINTKQYNTVAKR